MKIQIDNARLIAAITDLVRETDGSLCVKSEVRIGTVDGMALCLCISAENREMELPEPSEFRAVKQTSTLRERIGIRD